MRGRDGRSLGTRLGDLLGTRVEGISALGSSHSWTLHRAALADGREVFVKAAPDRADVFAAEAAGLRWLAEAGPGTPVPDVLAAEEGLLVLPWLPTGRPGPDAAERFGRELAAMHASEPSDPEPSDPEPSDPEPSDPAPSAPPPRSAASEPRPAAPSVYGAPWEGFIADLPLDNTLDGRDWPRWYAERRLEPYLRRAAGDLGRDGVRLVERVIEGIDGLAGPPEPPARVHGDLWSGNVLWQEGRAVLIDPAAHGGHRETDLAMLALFGAPGLDRVLAAYDEARPLAPGRRERVPLHQLHPLLVHVALFGGSYAAATAEAAAAALAAG